MQRVLVSLVGQPENKITRLWWYLEVMACKIYATEYYTWLLSFTYHCWVPNIMVPWNGGTMYKHCCNFNMVKPKYIKIVIIIWQCALYYYKSQIEEYRCKWWVFVPNIMESSVVFSVTSYKTILKFLSWTLHNAVVSQNANIIAPWLLK